MLADADALTVSSLCLLLQQPGPANNWNVCSPSAAGGMQPPDDWEIDISQLHIDSKVRPDRSCLVAVHAAATAPAAADCWRQQTSGLTSYWLTCNTLHSATGSAANRAMCSCARMQPALQAY
jgi:hypothetical protein